MFPFSPQIALALLLALFAGTLRSQTKTDYTFATIEKGGTHRAVTKIVQDHKGLIWMSTNGSGLYNYNGIEYKSYRRIANDSTSINSSLVYTVFIDSSHRLWIGTENGLNLYDRDLDSFIEINLNKEPTTDTAFPVYAISENRDGVLLVGTYNKGLFKLDGKTFKSEQIAFETPYQQTDILINSIVQDKAGNMLVGSTKGLFIFRNDNKPIGLAKIRTKTGIRTVSKGIQSLLKDREDHIWIGTLADGLLKVELDNVGDDRVSEYAISDKRILSIVETPNGHILCGTENEGLFVLDSNGILLDNYRYDKLDNDNIKSNSIWSLFVDKEERVWMGYYNKGVAIYDRYFDKFSDIESLPNIKNSLQSSSVMGITQDDKGNLWFGIDGGGVDVYNPSTDGFTHLSDPENGMAKGMYGLDVQTIFIDSKETIWVGTWNSGVFFKPQGADSFRNMQVAHPFNESSFKRITCFSEDSQGIIWVGTYYNGLYSVNPIGNKVTYHNESAFKEAGLDGANILDVLTDSNNAIWVATTKGLFKIIGSEKDTYQIEPQNDGMFQTLGNSVNTTITLSLFEDENQNIWIGTDGDGLCKYDPTTDSFTWFNSSNGLVQETVASIISDDSGNIWLGGDSGLSKLNTVTGDFANFNSNDGLLANNFNTNSVFKTKEGMLYFGNYEGINYFNPVNIVLNKNEPSLYFSNLKLFNKSVVPGEKDSPLKKVISETDHLTLTHKQSVFTIEFVGIGYTRPQNNQYAYYLEGFESSWNYVDNVRSATYTNLPSGNYVFKVKAANNDGVWNQSPIQLVITVLPPWWITKIAIASYIFAFLLLTYLIMRFLNQRLKEKRLIKFEREKRRQEELLNAKKIQFFTNISHEFRTPLTLIINPLRDIVEHSEISLSEGVRNKHKIILKNVKRLMRLINELMDFRKLNFDKMTLNATKLDAVPFVKEVAGHFDEDASEKNIIFCIESDGSPINLWGDPSMLEKIIFNLLSNAFKATPDNGAITVGIRNSKKPIVLPLINRVEAIPAIEIIIEDTGSGIKEEEVTRIFERFYRAKEMNSQYYGASGTGIGLEVVQNFVNLHKGKIEVKSVKGEGTSIKIIFPTGKDHFEFSELVTTQNKEVRQIDNSTLLADEKKIDSLNNHGINLFAGERKTLLIVEDNKGLRDYLKGELEIDYHIMMAENGKKGLKLAHNGTPDIIITDVIMPEMDGYEFCANIKEDIKTSHIPVIMLTAKVMVDDKVKGIDTGADVYLSKPFEMKVLRSYLKRFIQSRQQFFDRYRKDSNLIALAEHTTTLDKSFITKVLDYIDQNIADADLNVEQLAEDMHLSRSQLYRKIKALVGMTANELIRKIRLERAKQLIENGDESISEVGFKVGFSSPSYFTKCFKSHFGILPTELKNS